MTHEDILTVSSAKSADATQEIGSRSRRLYKHGTAGKGDRMKAEVLIPYLEEKATRCAISLILEGQIKAPVYKKILKELKEDDREGGQDNGAD